MLLRACVELQNSLIRFSHCPLFLFQWFSLYLYVSVCKIFCLRVDVEVTVVESSESNTVASSTVVSSR